MAILKTASRKISNRGLRRVIGITPSRKNRCVVHWESLAERDYHTTLEFDKTVAQYLPQPEKIDYWLNGVRHTFTPDVRVTSTTGEVSFHEVKHTNLASNSPLRPLLDAAGAQIRSQGYEFLMVAAEKFRRGETISNIRALYRYGSSQVLPSLRERLDTVLPRSTESTLGDLWLAIPGAELPGLYRLLYDEVLGADLESELLGIHTRVWRDAR